MTGENPEQLLITGMHMRWRTGTGSRKWQVFTATMHAQPRRELRLGQKAEQRREKSVLLHGGGGCKTCCPGGLLGRSLRASAIELPKVIAGCVQCILCRFAQGSQTQRKIGLIRPLFPAAITLQIRHNALVLNRRSFLLRLECTSTDKTTIMTHELKGLRL
jgi:hypothetical protein